MKKEWKESDAPFVTVATLTVAFQGVPDDGIIEAIKSLSFTTFKCLQEYRPIGVIQTSRSQAYKSSSDTCHKLNNIKRKEPSDLKKVFDKLNTK